MYSPSSISRRSRSLPRRWRSWCWSPIRCSIPQGDFALLDGRVQRTWRYALDLFGHRVVPPGTVRGLQPGQISAAAAAPARDGCTAAAWPAISRRLERRRHASSGWPRFNDRDEQPEGHPGRDRRRCRRPRVNAGASEGAGAAAESAAANGVRSGQKYQTPQGFTAIKDGIKRQASPIGPAWPASRAGCGRRLRSARATSSCAVRCASTGSRRCARRPSARTSANAGTPALRRSC